MYNVKGMTFLGSWLHIQLCSFTYLQYDILWKYYSSGALFVKNTGKSARANLFCGQSGEGGKTIYSFRFTLWTLMAFRNSMQFVKFHQHNRFSFRRPFRWNIGTGEWCDWLSHLLHMFVDFVTNCKLCFELSNCWLCEASWLVSTAVCCVFLHQISRNRHKRTNKICLLKRAWICNPKTPFFGTMPIPN